MHFLWGYTQELHTRHMFSSFQSSCSNLHPYQQCLRAPTALCPCHHSVFSFIQVYSFCRWLVETINLKFCVLFAFPCWLVMSSTFPMFISYFDICFYHIYFQSFDYSLGSFFLLYSWYTFLWDECITTNFPHYFYSLNKILSRHS